MLKTHLIAVFLICSIHAEDYCFGFLNSVADRKKIPDAEAEEIQKGHMAHMNRMSKAGHLIAAGPIMSPGATRGILVYRCKSLEEAREQTSVDPMVINKRLDVDFHMWRGPKDFGEPLGAQLRADPNAKYNMVQLPLILLKKTSSWTTDPVEVLAEHHREIAAMQKAGSVRAVGPVLRSTSLASIMVLSKMPLAEAEKAAKEMALVRGGYATVQALLWFVADESIPVLLQ